MSQNIRAVDGPSPRHGRIWKVDGSGLASMSASYTRANPSIAEPSKPIPSANAASSSAGATATDFRKPRTSVNQSRTNRTSRSSSARSTKSSCLPMAPPYRRARSEERNLLQLGQPRRRRGVRRHPPVAARAHRAAVAHLRAVGQRRPLELVGEEPLDEHLEPRADLAEVVVDVLGLGVVRRPLPRLRVLPRV